MARTYTEEEKARAVALAIEVGQYRAAKDLGIPRTTLAHWLSLAGATGTDDGRKRLEAANEARDIRIAEKRSIIMEGFADLAIVCINYAKDPGTLARDVKDYTISAATSLDKLMLMMGEATSRDEHTGKDGAPILGGVVIQLPTNGRDIEEAEFEEVVSDDG